MDCISFVENADEEDLRKSLTAPAMDESQDLYVSDELRTKRVMVKDEDVCLHCGLCAERCPTNAWDMQRSVPCAPIRFLQSMRPANDIMLNDFIFASRT